MKTKQNTAMVEMGTPEGVDNVMKNLRDITIFGEQVRFDVSKKHLRIVSTPPEFELADGSSSVKSYYGARDMNRFMTQEQASKNRIIRPSKVRKSRQTKILHKWKEDPAVGPGWYKNVEKKSVTVNR